MSTRSEAADRPDDMVIRTNLYVPGDRPDRFDKAVASGADAIILDLEDAVAHEAKQRARREVAAWLGQHPDARAWVRVNNRPDLLADDLAMVRDFPAAGVVMPKAEPDVCDVGDLRVIALIETARGVALLAETAAVDAVFRLALGAADLAADLGMEPSADGHEWAPIRSRMVVTSAVAGLDAPIGPVHTDIADAEGLISTTQALRREGFGGRSAIHPRQIAPIHDAFAASEEQLRWAKAVLASVEEEAGATAVVDGEFVDGAVLRRARHLLGLAERP